MKCEDAAERLNALQGNAFHRAERRRIEEHMWSCEECRSAMRGAEAMRAVKSQPAQPAPDELLARIIDGVADADMPAKSNRSFWLGAGLGGSLAAAIAVVALTIGFFTSETAPEAGIARFMISAEETRDLNVAIQLERELPGATLSVILSGGVELAGFGAQRELVWTADLDKGLNKLTLPVFATGGNGGQLIVKLDHAASHQVFVVNLTVDS